MFRNCIYEIKTKTFFLTPHELESLILILKRKVFLIFYSLIKIKKKTLYSLKVNLYKCLREKSKMINNGYCNTEFLKQ